MSDLPGVVDLSRWLSGPVFDQGGHPLCTASVTVALAEYWAVRTYGRRFRGSVLFNYRMSRCLAGRRDRRGSTLRDAFAAWQRYGLPDETRWPYSPERVDADPPPDLLAGRWLRVGRYERVDRPGLAPEEYLRRMRAHLASGRPVTVEFPLGPSLLSSMTDGVIALPPPEDPVVGRHVVLAVGYDDGGGSGGTLRFRNNWGDAWGERGHGRLPYEFLLRAVARQSWVVHDIDP